MILSDFIKKNIIKLVLIGMVIVTIPISLWGCNNNSVPVSKTTLAFDTVVTITIYDNDQDGRNSSLIDECFNLCTYYENLFSRTIPSSEISKINSSNGKPIKVSDETLEIIKKGIYYGDISDGLFDITIAPVSSLWDFHGNSNNTSDTNGSDENKIPNREDLIEAVRHVSYKNIIVDDSAQTITLSDNGSMIDLGGIAKGYIADKLKEYLVDNGISSALIDLGGNILAIGVKPDGTPFKIGIKKPFKNNEIETSVELNDNAVSTSGVYERFFLLDDDSAPLANDYLYIDNKKLYHHILNPKTGYPTYTDLYGASIVCKNSVDADAFSTIYILKGYNEGKIFFDSLNDVKAICSPAE